MKILRITTVPQSLHKLLKAQIDYLSEEYEIITVSGFSDQKDTEYAEWNYKHYFIALTRSINPIKDLKAIWQLYKIIKREKPAIVHTHTPKAGFVGMIASKLAGTKIRFHTVAGMPLSELNGIQKRLLLLIEQLTYSLSHQVFPNSKGLCNFIVQNKLAPIKKLKVISNGGTTGIDIEEFKRTEEIEKLAKSIKQSNGIGEGEVILCFIGRLTKQKGMEELLEAVQDIFTSFSKIKLILLGRYEQHLDPIKEEYVELIKNDKRIIHFGYQLDVRPYLAMSDIFVFPSYREGLPNVVLQAGSFDLPCIVTDIPGSNEIIKDQINGIVIKPKDTHSLKNAIQLLLENENLRKQFSSSIRESIVSRYDKNLVLMGLKDEYSKWINEKNI